jgi:hypothetical protein
MLLWFFPLLCYDILYYYQNYFIIQKLKITEKFVTILYILVH